MSNEEEQQEQPTVAEIIKNTSEEIKEFWLMVFLLLNRSDRFVKFIEDNFEIEKGIDEENKVIDVRVTEKDPNDQVRKLVIPPQDQMKIHELLKQSGCDKPASTAQELVKVLEGRGESPIVEASEKDLEEWKKDQH